MPYRDPGLAPGATSLGDDPGQDQPSGAGPGMIKTAHNDAATPAVGEEEPDRLGQGKARQGPPEDGIETSRVVDPPGVFNGPRSASPTNAVTSRRTATRLATCGRSS
jgi:hypothetical protein